MTTKADWKLYNASLIGWRDRYVERINRTLIITLADVGAEVIERFWSAHDRINAESRLLRQCFDGGSRSTMIFHLLSMQAAGIIDESDLEGFSEEVRNVLSGATDIPREDPEEEDENENELGDPDEHDS